MRPELMNELSGIGISLLHRHRQQLWISLFFTLLVNTEMNQECRNAKNKHRLETAHLSVLLKIQATT